MNKKILGLGLGFCLLASGATIFTGCGGEKKYNVTIDYNPAHVITRYGVNTAVSSDVLDIFDGNKVISLQGYPDVYNYDDMTVTINGEDAGSKFVKNVQDGDYLERKIGYIELTGSEDVTIKIDNIKEREIKLAFTVSTDKILSELDRTVFEGEDANDKALDYSHRALLFANNYRLKLKESEQQGMSETNENGTLMTEIIGKKTKDVIFNDGTNTYYAPQFYTFTASDFYSTYTSEETYNGVEYTHYSYEYQGIPVYNDLGPSYLTNPEVRVFRVAESFSSGNEFTGYNGNLYAQIGELWSIAQATNRSDREKLTDEQLRHEEYISVKVLDNTLVVINPERLSYNNKNAIYANDDLTYFIVSEGGSYSNAINETGYVGGIRRFETTSYEDLINGGGVEFTDETTLKINDHIVEKVADEATALEKLEEGVPAVCVYDEIKMSFTFWLNGKILPIHLYTNESIRRGDSLQQYYVELTKYAIKEENFIKLTAKNGANVANSDGQAWDLSSDSRIINGAEGEKYIAKTASSLTIDFLQPVDHNNLERKTVITIKKDGVVDQTIYLMDEIAKEKTNLKDDGSGLKYISFEVGEYSFVVLFENIDAEAEEIVSAGNIYQVIINLPIVNVNAYDIQTSLID